MPGKTRITHFELANNLKTHISEALNNHPLRRVRGVGEETSIKQIRKLYSDYYLKLNYPSGGREKNPILAKQIDELIFNSLKIHKREHPNFIIESHSVEDKGRTSTYKFTIKSNSDFKKKK